MNKSLLGFLVTAGAMVIAPVAFADEAKIKSAAAQDDADTVETSTDNAPAMSNSLRAVRDEKTGKLRAPNPAELRKMEEAESAASKARGAPSAAASAPVVKYHADGMRSVELGPEYLMSLEGERNDDGVLERSHDAELNETTVVADELPTE